jgi:hypothetical protein
MRSYKNPRLRIAIKENRVRLLTCKFQIIGIGKVANRTSVTMFTPARNVNTERGRGCRVESTNSC